MSTTICKGIIRNHLASHSQVLYEASVVGRKKEYIDNPGHMSKMVVMPTCQNLPQNLKFKDLETLNLASANRVIQCVYKLRLCDDLDLFYGKVILGGPCILFWENLVGKFHLVWKSCMELAYRQKIYTTNYK